tara:strand:+ start:1865 stop:2524 length:660 start_codon:yes stop_codon:yes gene_type:complete
VIINSAVIVAGGMGTRAKSKIPKQFIKINNKRIIDFSIRIFKANKYIDEIIIAVCKGWDEIISSENSHCKVIIGGSSRTESVFRALKKCSTKTKNVIIHDAARPFISNQFIDSFFLELLKNDAVIPVLTNVDSVIEYKNKLLNYLDRDSIKFVQTPQGFNYNILFNAYNQNNGELIFSDDMSLLKFYNPQINFSILDGEKTNFKITNQQDIYRAKDLLI